MRTVCARCGISKCRCPVQACPKPKRHSTCDTGPSARVSRTETLTVASTLTIPFNIVEWDIGNLYQPPAEDRLIATVAGKYLVEIQIELSGMNSGSDAEVTIFKEPGHLAQVQNLKTEGATVFGFMRLNAITTVDLAVGEYVTAFLEVAPQDINPSLNKATFIATKIAPAGLT